MGELRTYHPTRVLELTVGAVVDQDGEPVYLRDDPTTRASDSVVVDLNYATGRAWLEPAHG